MSTSFNSNQTVSQPGQPAAKRTSRPFRFAVDMPIGGLNSQLPTFNLDPREASVLQNGRLVAGELQKRTGYTQLSNAVIKAGEQVNGVFYFKDNVAGTNHLIACGQTVIKEFNFSTGLWTDRTGTTIPTGGASTLWRSCQVINPADNKKYLIVTNGTDKPQKWDGVAATFSDLVVTPPTGVTKLVFSACIGTQGRILAGNLSEDTTNKPLAVRWSSLGDITDWNGPGAGTATLFDSLGDQLASTKVQNLSIKQSRPVIYMDESIIPVQTGPTADNAYTFSPSQVISQGLKAAGALDPIITELGSYDFIQTDNDFVIYDGNSVYPVGLNIRISFFQNLNPNSAQNSFTVTSLSNKEIWVFAPFGNLTFCQNAAIFNFQVDSAGARSPSNKWLYWKFGQIMTSATHWFRTASTTIAQLPGTIASLGGTIGGQLTQNYPVVITGGTDGNIYQWDDATLNDGATAIEFDYQTGDMDLGELVGFPGRVNRLIAVNVFYRDQGAATLTVSTSIDGGATFRSVQTKTIGNISIGKKKAGSFFMNVSGTSHRIRLYNNSLNQGLFIQGIEYVFIVGPEAEGGYGVN